MCQIWEELQLLPQAHTALPCMESPEQHFTLHKVLTAADTITVEVTLSKTLLASTALLNPSSALFLSFLFFFKLF